MAKSIPHVNGGKIVNYSFPPTLNKSTTLFELIHIDNQGPAPILSHLGHHFYIHFLDNYNKYSWFHVIKNHLDTLKVFRAFCLQIENLFEYKINILQSDDAKKFLI